MNPSNWTGEKIREQRLTVGLSQKDLAKKLGCRQQTISEWESGRYLPQNAYSKLLDNIFSSPAVPVSIQLSEAFNVEED